jgi:hypothetical protein
MGKLKAILLGYVALSLLTFSEWCFKLAGLFMDTSSQLQIVRANKEKCKELLKELRGI